MTARPVVMDMHRELPGPPDLVWALLTDWEHQDDWMLEASDFAVTSPAREGVGVEAAATIRIGGIRTRDRIRVTGWEEPSRLVIDHLGWVKGVGDIRLAARPGGGTRLDWRETLYAPLGAAGWIGLVVFRPLMRHIFERDLRVLAGLVRVAARGPKEMGS